MFLLNHWIQNIIAEKATVHKGMSQNYTWMVLWSYSHRNLSQNLNMYDYTISTLTIYSIPP
jgi:hypothetical protein